MLDQQELRQIENRKIQLEPSSFQPGLEVAEPFKALSGPEIMLRNEIKALQQSNRELRASNDEWKTYAHTVAHALKNPLAVLVVIASAMAEISDLTPQELKEYREQIKLTAYDMNTIIDDIMFLSEVNMADRPAEPLDMPVVVKKASKRLDSMTKAYRGRILVPKTWPVANGYAPWIEEVWVNYISNALKYGGRSPRIELGAFIQPDGMIRFWTRDNGPGIPSEKQAALFTPFTRVGQVRRPGNGLGLSIVRQIVEKSGGEAGVVSEAGKGSLFFFTLPASGPEYAPERPALANQTQGGRTASQRASFQPA